MNSLASDPLKWEKYLRLVQFGFVTQKELERDIRRYKRSDRRASMQDIALDLHSESLTGRRNLYVVKLVSFELSGRLPNFRIEQLEDIKGLPEFFLRNEDTNYVEVWYCRTRVDEDVSCLPTRATPGHSLLSRSGDVVPACWNITLRILITPTCVRHGIPGIGVTRSNTFACRRSLA